MRGRLPGGVAGADHANVPAPHRTRLARCGAIEDSRADQLLQLGDPESPPRDAGGEHHRASGDLLTAGHSDDVMRRRGTERRCVLRENDVGSEQPRLLARAAREVVTADTPGEAGDVPDTGARASLTPGDVALENDRVQPF